MIDNETARHFALYMKKYAHLYDELAKSVKHYVTSNTPVLVDVGCGPGLLLLSLHHYFPEAQLYGIDPHKEMVALSKENIKQHKMHNCKILEGVSEHIPLNDGMADAIVSRFSLSYWKNPQKSFSEIHRLLKSEGIVSIETINKDFPRWKLFFIKLHMLCNRAGRKVTKYHIDVYDQAYTQHEVEAFLQQAGFTIIKKEGKQNDWKFLLVGRKEQKRP